MEGLKIYDQDDIRALISFRDGERKLGEFVQTLPSRHCDSDISSGEVISIENLKNSTAKFVLLGIPEDIGIRANHGIGGASSAWLSSLKVILNIQSNAFLKGDELLVLGHFNFDEPRKHNINGLRQKVTEIDDYIYPIIEQIVASGKTPIVIGGGHNNAYPIIKGVSLGKGQSIDVINIDAHADLRPLEGRHSGNGFSYALHDSFLNNYAMFGLHQSYNNELILNHINNNPSIQAVFFDDILKSELPLTNHWHSLINHLDNDFGIEIDLDSVEGILSSAATPSGFALNDIRKLILNTKQPISYLHICEGAVELEDGRKNIATAKAVAYLVGDFVKSACI